MLHHKLLQKKTALFCSQLQQVCCRPATPKRTQVMQRRKTPKPSHLLLADLHGLLLHLQLLKSRSFFCMPWLITLRPCAFRQRALHRIFCGNIFADDGLLQPNMLTKPLYCLRLSQQLFVSYMCRKEEDVDPEQIRKDMERLELIKRKRYIWQSACSHG